jgi:autotransporter-associated beta strand protein
MTSRLFAKISAALLLASVSAPALAADEALIIGSFDSAGLQARLAAAGYGVTVAQTANDLPLSLDSFTQVWDLRLFDPIGSSEGALMMSYLGEGGGLFLIGENASFATRNNSLISFINDAGGGGITYGGNTVGQIYVTGEFNGDGAVVPDISQSFMVPAAGTFSSPGNGTYFTTTGPNGTGEGVGAAFGNGSLSQVPNGRILTYLDVNTFGGTYVSQYATLSNLVDRMIGFIAGDFQVDPNLPPVGGGNGPGTIDGSEPAFDLTSPAATSGTVVFDGGLLLMTNGAGGATLAADVLVNSAGGFVDTINGEAAMTGTITGQGGINVSGGGNLVVSGTNTHTGGMMVMADTTLTITNASALGTGGAVLNGGTLATTDDMNIANNVLLIAGGNAIDTGDSAVTISGLIEGAGSFEKKGDGVLTLTGANSFTGGTTISGGTLAGDTTSLTGDVVNNAALQFAQASNGTFAGDVSGTGSLQKTGDGVLTLTGQNSYTGGTTISGGTLVGDTTSLTGDVVNNAALQFAQASNGTFAGDVSGTGSLQKTGDGVLNLTGQNSYTGGTTVQGGALAVNGSLVSVVDVQAGAQIMGRGQIGGLIVRNAATLAPGNSIDTLRVATDALFERGSIYEVELTAAGDTDLLVVDGAVTIEGGTVAVMAENGNYAPLSSYTIITANSVEGTFEGVTSNLAFLIPSLGYTDSAVTLQLLRNDVTFRGVAATANQRATASAIESAFDPATPLYSALVRQSADGARAAFNSLSGEIHTSAIRSVVQDSERFRRSVLSRFGAADVPSNGGLWLQVAAAKDDVDGDGNAASFDRKTMSYFGGAEVKVGRGKIGMAGGFTKGDARIAGSSTAAVEGMHLGAYAGTIFGPLALSAGVTYGSFDIATIRAITAGSISQTAVADYQIESYETFAEAGIRVNKGLSVLEPFVGLHRVWVDREGITEHRANLGVRSAAQDSSWTFTTVGAKAYVPLSSAETVTLNIAARWQHAIDGQAVETDLAFIAGGPAFTVAGPPISRDAGLFDASLNWRLGAGLTLGVEYSGRLDEGSQSHAGKATLGFRF